MAEVDKLSRQDALDLAKKMRNKVRNLELDRKDIMFRVGQTAAGAVTAYLVGSYMGGLEVEYEQNAAAIEAGTMDDPRKIVGIDIDLLLGLGLMGGGNMGLGGKKFSQYVKSAGDGVLAGYSFSLGFRHGRESAQTA